MPLTLGEGAFESLPLFIFHSCEVSVVEIASDFLNICVEKCAFSVKLIVEPISLVSYGAFRVEESSIAIHVVILPFSIIDATALIVELTISVSLLVLNESLVF